MAERKAVVIPMEIWSMSDISPNARVVLAEIFSFQNAGRECWASNDHFAALLHVTNGGARKIIRELETKGKITKKTGRINGIDVRILGVTTVTGGVTTVTGGVSLQ